MNDFIRKNVWLFVSLILFSTLFLPFITTLPLRDGNIDFVQSYYFFQGGYDKFFLHFNSAHPPLKVFTLSMLYQIFGVHPEFPALLGYILGFGGIIGGFITSKKLSNTKTASLFVTLLSINPLFISSGIFSLTDYILTNLILISLALFLNNKLFLYTLSLIAIVLTKETGILFVIILLAVDIIYSQKRIRTLMPYIAAFAAYGLWQYFLHSLGKSSWKDYLFTSTADRGTFYTVFHNIITLQIINGYAHQQLLQLLFLNSNWIMIGSSIILTFVFFSNKVDRTKFINQLIAPNQKSKAIITIALFCFLYFISVLSLQTFTIPRYALPIIPFLILWFSVSIQKLKTIIIERILVTIVFSVSLISLFISPDPFASSLWGKTDLLGQNIYSMANTISGNDGVVYNLQFIKGGKLRTKIIKGYATNHDAAPWRLCKDLFPDPKNDLITMRVSGLGSAAHCLTSPNVNW